MADRKTPSAKLAHWFKTLVRPIFQKTEPAPALEELDKLAAQVEELGGRQSELYPICLLGQAGVGKSTLINTLVADNDIVVPSGGGTGPLTASALHVVYGETKSFVVRYHPPAQINRMQFVLNNELTRKFRGNASEAESESDPDDADEYREIELDSEEQKKTRTEEAIGRSCLLVAGVQNAMRELPYLIDALRWVLGKDSKFNTQFVDEDLERLRRIRDAVKYGSEKTAVSFYSVGNYEFAHHLRDHASGFLAPMILEMTIRWPSPLLQNSLELIDLPGIGIIGDTHASITTDHLRNHAKAVMLVADSRGLRREDAELLQKSGFLNRLLHSSDDLSQDPVAFIVAAVRIDDVAIENWQNDRAINGKARRTMAQHFSDQVDRCRADMALRLAGFLREVWQDDTQGKRDVIQSIVDNLQVFPVSAPEYRLLVSTEPDERRAPFLPDVEATNIPALREAIADVARRCVTERERRAAEVRGRFLGQLRAKLEVLSAQWNDERRAEEAIEHFSQELDTFLAPHRREFDNRRGAFRAFLRKAVPYLIESKVRVASGVAEKSINKYLSGHHDTHWKTLQAAVRREGTFIGSRNINLPKDFALKFEEPVAEVWSREILVEIRKETGGFADYQNAAVNEVLEWARGKGIGSTKLLEALLEEVRQHRKQVNAVGKDAVEELRGRVRDELIKKIEGPIRSRCGKFVKDGLDYGRGVKSRIEELFKELAEDVVLVASTPAIALLQERFGEVETEIRIAFRDHADPLNQAAEALIQKHEKRTLAGDAKAREFAEVIDAALAAAPEIDGASA